MRKLALTALAAAMATIGLASVASADSRNGDDEWRHQRDNGKVAAASYSLLFIHSL